MTSLLYVGVGLLLVAASLLFLGLGVWAARRSRWLYLIGFWGCIVVGGPGLLLTAEGVILMLAR